MIIDWVLMFKNLKKDWNKEGNEFMFLTEEQQSICMSSGHLFTLVCTACIDFVPW